MSNRRIGFRAEYFPLKQYVPSSLDSTVLSLKLGNKWLVVSSLKKWLVDSSDLILIMLVYPSI